MTFRDDMLEILDEVRGIPGDLGMRLFSVTVLSRAWTGARTGIGVKTDTSTRIYVARGTFNARVKGVTSRDVIASGGLYTSEDIKVGPFTPPFLGSDANGTAISVFDPPSKSGLELLFKVIGPGYATAGDWFKKIDSDTMSTLHYALTLRKTGEVP